MTNRGKTRESGIIQKWQGKWIKMWERDSLRLECEKESEIRVRDEKKQKGSETNMEVNETLGDEWDRHGSK